MGAERYSHTHEDTYPCDGLLVARKEETVTRTICRFGCALAPKRPKCSDELRTIPGHPRLGSGDETSPGASSPRWPSSSQVDSRAIDDTDCSHLRFGTRCTTHSRLSQGQSITPIAATQGSAPNGPTHSRCSQGQSITPIAATSINRSGGFSELPMHRLSTSYRQDLRAYWRHRRWL